MTLLPASLGTASATPGDASPRCNSVSGAIGPDLAGFSCTALSPSPTTRWTRALDGQSSYPLIAGGRVFVTTSTPLGPYGGKLQAFDLATGLPSWPSVQVSTSYYSFPLLYDNGAVVVSDTTNVLRSYDATTGALLWSHPNDVATMAVAARGTLYLAGSYLVALDTRTGARLWRTYLGGATGQNVAVDETGIYVSGLCGYRARFDFTGVPVWTGTGSCLSTSSASVTANFFIDRDGTVVNKLTGVPVGTAEGHVAADPAVIVELMDDSLHTLRAFDPATFVLRWERQIGSPGETVIGPVLAGGTIYVGVGSRVLAIDAATSAKVDKMLLPAGVSGPTLGATPTNLAIGESSLVVPAGDTLTAFG